MNDLWVLFKNDLRMLLNLRREAHKQSVFKGLVVGVFAISILTGLYFMFLDSFKFLGMMGGIGVFVIQHLFGLFFFGLALMLILSNIVTAYASFFRAEDVSFLLLEPVSRGTLAVHKLFESAALSSWAFFFIMIPFVTAFAWYQKLPLMFAFWTLVFSIPLVALCGGIGSILILILVRFLPRLRTWMWFVILLILFCAMWFHTGKRVDHSASNAPFYLTGLIPGIRCASFPLWPSWWVSEGIMAMTRERWVRGFMLLGVLTSNVLLVIMIVREIGERLFYRVWERLMSSAELRTLKKSDYFDLMKLLTRFFPPDYRAIIQKDVRSILRDPTQIIQGLLFFGLLGIYFFNLRGLHYHLLPPIWRNLISFLNLFSLATIMSSFCSRFIFPQISLEGHSFWIIGLSPTGMPRVLNIKFAFSVGMMLVISGTLMMISTLMLAVSTYILLITMVVAVAMSFGFSGLALGLGTIFMDLKQTNPVAILSGFGGTLNLVLSLVYMVGAIFPFGFLCHQYVIGHISRSFFAYGISMSGVWLMFITLLAVLLPLTIAGRCLKTSEY
jgi:ABC-2 type transport system permease protein